MNVQAVIKWIDLCSYPEEKNVENNSLFQVEFSKGYVSKACSWDKDPEILLFFQIILIPPRLIKRRKTKPKTNTKKPQSKPKQTTTTTKTKQNKTTTPKTPNKQKNPTQNKYPKVCLVIDTLFFISSVCGMVNRNSTLCYFSTSYISKT